MTTQLILSEKDLDYIEQRLQDVFATKEELTKVKSDLMNVLDKILKNTEATRQEMTILSHRTTEHEDRLTTVETKLSTPTN